MKAVWTLNSLLRAVLAAIAERQSAERYVANYMEKRRAARIVKLEAMEQALFEQEARR